MRIQDFKVVYICPDHNEKYHARKLHMDLLLSELGFKDIEHFKSGTEGYPNCLAQANIEILTKYMDIPFILLEDDVEFTGVSEFDFVHGADAIYLGVSVWASHPSADSNQGTCVTKNYSDKQVQVLNMLGTHAILYITPAYKQACIHAMRNAVGHTDIAISRIQPNFRVLANRIPSFYQSVNYNGPMHDDKHTLFVLNGREKAPGQLPVVPLKTLIARKMASSRVGPSSNFRTA